MDTTIYTIPERCPHCRALKRYLDSIGVKYTEEDMTTPASLTELRINGVFATAAPVIQVGDRFIEYNEIFDGDVIRKDVIREAVS